MDKKTNKRFGMIVRSYIRTHRDVKTKRLVADPDKWLAKKLDKTIGTIRTYLGGPQALSLPFRAHLIRILREGLIIEDPIDLLVDLIDSIPERKS